MDFGCHLPVFGPIATRENVLAFARRMEALGYSSLWASDHVAIPHRIGSRYPYSGTGDFPLPASASFLEPLMTLGLVAGVTERVKLGTTVLVLPHRHPVLAAKMLATLDHLSGGRVILGAGVGWMREEIELLGGPFDERGPWSDEALRIMRACWASDRASHKGRYFSFDEISVAPLPPRRSIPVWIGGHSAGAFRRVAALGDGWHAAFASVEDVAAGIARVRQECARQGRRFEEMTLSLRAGLSIRPGPGGRDRKPLQGSVEEIVGDLRRYRDLGVTTVLLETRLRSLDDLIQIHETFARDIRPLV